VKFPRSIEGKTMRDKAKKKIFREQIGIKICYHRRKIIITAWPCKKNGKSTDNEKGIRRDKKNKMVSERY
jgi:hypothetical protein